MEHVCQIAKPNLAVAMSNHRVFQPQRVWRRSNSTSSCQQRCMAICQTSPPARSITVQLLPQLHLGSRVRRA